MRQIDLPNIQVPEIIDEHLPWNARASVLIASYGFQPTTIAEINTSFSGVIAFDEVPAQAGAHLQEVFLHQKMNPDVDSPDRAVRAIAHELGHYYIDAVNRRDSLRSVYDKLSEGVNPNLDILELEELDALGVLSSIQHYAVRKGISSVQNAALSGGIKKFDNEYRLVTAFDIYHDNYANQAAIEVLIRRVPEDLRKTGGFRTLSLYAGRSQRTRRDWWRNGLVKSRSHLAARPVVDEILQLESVVR